MALSVLRRTLLCSSKEVLTKNLAVLHYSSSLVLPETHVHFGRVCNGAFCVLTTTKKNQFMQSINSEYAVAELKRYYSKKHYSASSKQKEENESDSDSDDEFENKRRNLNSKTSERGDSEFWRRKMRTFHRILDVNRDGVISFEDFTLLAKRFTDLGHLNPEMSAEFSHELKLMWEEAFGEVSPYNLVTAEQFLTDFHHRLNDKVMIKRLSKCLPFLFKAVDYDHNGFLNYEQYKLFFRCLGLSGDNAAVSFAVIDQNGDGQISLKEFVHLGRQFFITEDEKKISKMFWGPLIDH